jgi:PDDEXK-like domain of unknown function (DUF3799)
MDAQHTQLPQAHSEGIVFGMPENEYHADPSLGSTGLKHLMQSATDYWWRSWMNGDGGDDAETPGTRLGTAFHKLLLEGEAAFLASYAAAPDMTTTDAVLKTAEDLNSYLRRHGLPITGNKAILIERVRLHWQARNAGPCPILDEFLDIATDGGRKTLLSAQEFRRLQRAARMIESNPVLASLASSRPSQTSHHDPVPRFSEVSVFWCEPVRIESGDVVEVSCKARFDSLGLKTIIDVKTVSNTKGVALALAIPQLTHALCYDLQAAHYMTAREHARRLVRAGKVLAGPGATLPSEDWLKAFERIRPLRGHEDAASTLASYWSWLFVQMTGPPIVECRLARFDGDLMIAARVERELLLRRFAEHAARHGTEMWMHATAARELWRREMPRWRRFWMSRTDEDIGSETGHSSGL